eukprot:3374343-Prymnesium_polylepis.1
MHAWPFCASPRAAIRPARAPLAARLRERLRPPRPARLQPDVHVRGVPRAAGQHAGRAVDALRGRKPHGQAGKRKEAGRRLLPDRGARLRPVRPEERRLLVQLAVGQPQE